MSILNIPLSNEIPNFTWSTKPSPSNYPRKLIHISDIGINGSLWYSDGISKWIPTGYINLLSTYVPVGIPPSGSFGNNGALTLNTALNKVYSEGVYLYFPSGAIYSGSPPGLYYTVMSSTTVGTVYSDTYTSEEPTRPISPVPIVNTGPGAYTSPIDTRITLVSSKITGGIMGPLGRIRPSLLASCNNSAGTKTPSIWVGSIAIYNAGTTNTSSVSSSEVLMTNLGITNAQSISPHNSSTGIGPVAQVMNYGTVNTEADFSITFGGRITVATDWIILQNAFNRLESSW